VLAGDVEGTVRMPGLFSTTIDAPDNVQTMVGNAKIMNGTIKNFSNNPFRRVEIISFNERGPVLAVRPYCNTAHYWQV
jgi:small conductance mechanosensitive channel